jgi:hypothetical protein
VLEWIGQLTNERKYRPWLAYLIAFLYGGWFLFIASPLSNPLIGTLSRYVPGWPATLIWAWWLVLLPISQGSLIKPVNLRVSLYVSVLITSLFLPIAIHFHPVTTFLISVLFCAEAFWFMPRWKTRSKRQHEGK